eukprot:TRINITY_DN2623_c0_g1_i1.p1 TRINITY_DN2623_c0_g1~~TRINITY_DN2623_c0_g1_i1.p1  ORF type:complete len:392 (-),score=79.50 TRINITY_DN2623_c0_g1_i1:37-1212(-)
MTMTVFSMLILGCTTFLFLLSSSYAIMPSITSVSLEGLQETEVKRLYSEFESFVSIHEKTYQSEEEANYRFKVFSDNVMRIEEHNNKADQTFKMGINMFTDLTDEEFSARNRLNWTPPSQTGTPKVPSSSSMPSLKSLPSSKNWVTEGRVSPVKNQGSCGGCWAFATISTIESALAILESTNNVPVLSEQQLIDCDVDGNDDGCNGGFYTYAFDYYISKNKKVMTEECYPYTASDDSCKYSDDATCIRAEVLSYETLYCSPSNILNSYNLLMNAIQVNPVAIAINADEVQHYSSGILPFSVCGASSRPNHAVVVVGYGTDNGNDYWLVRNSWGPYWGENGYFRLERSTSANTCNMFYWEQSYPTVEPTSSAIGFMSLTLTVVMLLIVMVII